MSLRNLDRMNVKSAVLLWIVTTA